LPKIINKYGVIVILLWNILGVWVSLRHRVLYFFVSVMFQGASAVCMWRKVIHL